MRTLIRLIFRNGDLTDVWLGLATLLMLALMFSAFT